MVRLSSSDPRVLNDGGVTGEEMIKESIIVLGVTLPAAVLKFTLTPLVTPAMLLLKSVRAVPSVLS